MVKTKKPATVEVTENKHENAEKKKSVSPVVTKTQELEDMLKRTLADYQNLERRIEEERKQLSKLSALLLIEKILPVLDNLENAQAHLNDDGLEIVVKQFKDILAEEGVEEIHAEGQEFDPTLHEAVEIKQGQEDNKVVKVVSKGYKIEDKVIRPAKVVVSRTQADQKEADFQTETQGRLSNE